MGAIGHKKTPSDHNRGSGSWQSSVSSSTNHQLDRTLRKLLSVPGDLGHPVPDGARVLDLGCGNGNTVHALRAMGYDAVGCDLKFKKGLHRDHLERQQLITTIEPEPYRLPFDDNTFDFVFSKQVLEHVQNYDETLAEIRRVLRPTGVSLHVFPSRWRPIESHVHVPFASVFRPYWWLLFWAYLGIRKASQRRRGFGPSEVARRNREGLTTHTNYLPKREISRFVQRHFDEHQFCERAALSYSRLAPLYSALPLCHWLRSAYLSTFKARVLLIAKPHESDKPVSTVDYPV